MKYAISVPADQTIVYLAEKSFRWTIHHPNAILFDSINDAHMAAIANDPYGEFWIEYVLNEELFRSQKDTW